MSFMAAFTVLGGYNQNKSVHEGLAVLRKTSTFHVFLIANSLAFALSTTTKKGVIPALLNSWDSPKKRRYRPKRPILAQTLKY